MPILNLVSNQNIYTLYRKQLGFNNPSNRDQTYYKYIIQQPLINNNDVRQLPEEQIKTGRNILNNRLLKRVNSVLKVDLQNKSRILKNKPIEYELINKPSNYQLENNKNDNRSFWMIYYNIPEIPKNKEYSYINEQDEQDEQDKQDDQETEKKIENIIENFTIRENNSIIFIIIIIIFCIYRIYGTRN